MRFSDLTMRPVNFRWLDGVGRMEEKSDFSLMGIREEVRIVQ